METTLIDAEKKKIYSFWKDIPLIMNMEPEKFECLKQETRNQIIEILRTGIEDKNSEYSRRYALNAQEIRELLQKNLKTSLQNIYFHLNILLEEGFISEIEILKEGRFNKRYYGRTAKLFLFNKFADITQDKVDEGKKALIDIIKAISINKLPNNTENIIELFLKERWDGFIQNEIRLNKWFEKNAQSLIDSNIDVKNTYELFLALIINRSNTKYSKEMESLLKI